MSEVPGLSTEGAAQIQAMRQVNNESNAFQAQMFALRSAQDNKNAAHQGALETSRQVANSGR